MPKRLRVNSAPNWRKAKPRYLPEFRAFCDAVGQPTGVFDAVVTAVEKVDDCVRRVVETGQLQRLLISDHRRSRQCRCMINRDGSPNTAHTTNPVPVFCSTPIITALQNIALADLAPTVLHLMGLEIPKGDDGKGVVQGNLIQRIEKSGAS